MLTDEEGDCEHYLAMLVPIVRGGIAPVKPTYRRPSREARLRLKLEGAAS